MTQASLVPGAAAGTAIRLVRHGPVSFAVVGGVSLGNNLSDMRNAEIAAALRELGILYEVDGADRFRVLAYREAARTVAESPVSIEQLAEEGRLTELPNVGKTLAQKVDALIETGSIPSADKLKE